MVYEYMAALSTHPVEGRGMYERNVSHIESLVRDQNDWRDGCINLIASENVTSRRVRGSWARISPTATPKATRGALLPGHGED